MRDIKIDFYKGLLILGVVYGHIINALTFQTDVAVTTHIILRTFDMPFFMIIGGFLLSLKIGKISNLKYILNKVTTLLFPVCLWGLLFAMVIFVHANNLSFVNVANYISGFWFIWSIFICNAIILLINMILKDKFKIQLIALLVVMIGLHFIPAKLDIWNLSYMFPFFLLGFYLRKIYVRFNSRTIRYFYLFSIICYVVLVCFWKTDYTIWNTSGYILEGTWHKLLIIPYRLFIGLFGCITAYLVFNVVFNFSGKLSNWVSKIGKTSMMNYIIHSFLIGIVLTNIISIFINKQGNNIFVSNIMLLEFIIAPVGAVVISLLIYVFVTLVKKIPYVGKYLFGFKICNADLVINDIS